MKVQKIIKKNGTTLLIAGSLLLLPSCGLVDWVKEKFGGASACEDAGMADVVAGPVAAAADGSPVLASIEGKPLITKNMLDTEKKKLLESNPQLQAMMALMDEKQLDRNLIDGMTSREIIRKYVHDNKINDSDKYKKDFDLVISQVRDALNTRYFMDTFSVLVNDGEIKKFYEENKESIPNLLISRGGIESVAISFNNEQAARDFATKARAAKNDITRVAKEAGLADKVKDFKLVNDQSLGMDPELRDKIMEIKSTPSLNTFKIGKEYWIVAANKKEEPKYRALDQVKDELRQLIEKDKSMKRFEEEVARLKDEYRIQIDESFFADKVDNAQAVQASADQESIEGFEKAIEMADADDKSDEPTESKSTMNLA